LAAGFCADDFIGLNYAGGIIFYMEADGTGFVAAPSDQSTGSEWGCMAELVGADGRAIGTGWQNTQDILAECTPHPDEPDIAAQLCSELDLDGYTDWFLPSLGELYELQRNIGLLALGANHNVANLSNLSYWTSTEDNANNVVMKVGEYIYEANTKNSSLAVRAIRGF